MLLWKRMRQLFLGYIICTSLDNCEFFCGFLPMNLTCFLQEDLSAQLRAVKKRLKEAEEEQYKVWLLLHFEVKISFSFISRLNVFCQAEEDAAALRAELNSLQQQAMSGPLGGMSSTSYSPDHVMLMERELSNLKSQLEVRLIFQLLVFFYQYFRQCVEYFSS